MWGQPVYADVESFVKGWLLTTSVAALVTRADNGVSVYMAMPTGAPVPAVILTRVGGGPTARKDLPEETARMTFTCWGRTRAQAGTIARAVTVECESVARMPGYTAGGTTLAAAHVSRVFWLPDPDSDTARYIVDATFITVST